MQLIHFQPPKESLQGLVLMCPFEVPRRECTCYSLFFSPDNLLAEACGCAEDGWVSASWVRCHSHLSNWQRPQLHSGPTPMQRLQKPSGCTSATITHQSQAATGLRRDWLRLHKCKVTMHARLKTQVYAHAWLKTQWR